MTTGDLATFLSAGVRTATPLALAALGELLVERSGLINIGLEGAILAGAFGALLGASAGGLALGYLAAMGAGVVMALIFAFFVLRVRADQAAPRCVCRRVARFHFPCSRAFR